MEWSTNTAKHVGNYDCTSVSISSDQQTIDRITSDNLDPKIINTNELGKICIKLTNSIISGGNVKIMVSTYNDKTDMQSMTVQIINSLSNSSFIGSKKRVNMIIFEILRKFVISI